MEKILEAMEVLIDNKCLTVAEALEKVYISGHRKGVRDSEDTQLVLVEGTAGHATSARGKSRTNA